MHQRLAGLREVAEQCGHEDAAGAEADRVDVGAAADLPHGLQGVQNAAGVGVHPPVGLLGLRVAPADHEHLQALAQRLSLGEGRCSSVPRAIRAQSRARRVASLRTGPPTDGSATASPFCTVERAAPSSCGTAPRPSSRRSSTAWLHPSRPDDQDVVGPGFRRPGSWRRPRGRCGRTSRPCRATACRGLLENLPYRRLAMHLRPSRWPGGQCSRRRWASAGSAA